MATDTDTNPDTVEEQLAGVEFPDEDQKPKRKFSLANKKIKILLLLILVMGVEAAGFYVLVPSAADNGDSKKNGTGEQKDVEMVEVTIGTFQTTNGQAVPGTQMNVQCEVTAVVALNQEVVFEQAVSKKNKASVGQAIQHVLSGSSLPELNDPRRSVIRRKIREGINKVLRRSYVNEVILTDFRALPI